MKKNVKLWINDMKKNKASKGIKQGWCAGDFCVLLKVTCKDICDLRNGPKELRKKTIYMVPICGGGERYSRQRDQKVERAPRHTWACLVPRERGGVVENVIKKIALYKPY